ncbi:uncharacterized protein N7446_011870 [Penicillium canescens]|uniref:uncharacterized protein n=1 Tax=Penicillium canescens TaxID=5083 RepID=UPI0026DEC9BE|nr:uncharacterized protein N7446_011870 [Penicillium canescens]KAJ6047036.1 hypothetical protein N7446_011870 [Penicillium canescens]
MTRVNPVSSQQLDTVDAHEDRRRYTGETVGARTCPEGKSSLAKIVDRQPQLKKNTQGDGPVGPVDSAAGGLDGAPACGEGVPLRA